MNKTTLMAVVVSLFLFGSLAQASPKVLIIGIDGCRPDALQVANTPNLDALIAAGSVSYTATNEKTNGCSGANWTSMLTGTTIDQHHVVSNTVGSTGFASYDYENCPHFFSYLKEADSSLYTASYSDWGTLNSGLLLSRYANVTGSGTQSETAAMAANLLSNGDPDVVFVQLDSVDSAGHSMSFHPLQPVYRAAIENTDIDCGTILNALYSRPGYIDGSEDWLILCSTDHGGYGTEHVQPSGGAAVWTTFVIASGKSYQPGVDIGSPIIEDIAVTALDHMGIDTSTLGLDGRVLPLVGVPEPSTLVGLASLAIGGLMLSWFRRERKR